MDINDELAHTMAESLADECKALRAKLAEAEVNYTNALHDALSNSTIAGKLGSKLAEAEAENARLRVALTKIGASTAYQTWELRDIARKALEEGR